MNLPAAPRNDATQLLPGPAVEEERRDPRVQLLEDAWLLTIFTLLLATALPWFVNTFDIEFGPASWGIFALGVLYVSLGAVAQLTRANLAWRRRALTLVQALGVIVIGFVWQHAGGLQNPVFLMAFALPVIGASFISRWQPYFIATLGTVVVAAIALTQVPELRWYASGLGTMGAWLAGFFGAGFFGGTTIRMPFAGFYAPFGYSVVLLEVFAIILFACAAAAEYLGTMFERLRVQLSTARSEARRGQDLWLSLIEQLPAAALLVDADTLKVISASEALAPKFCDPDVAVGSPLFETLSFSYPEMVQELITGTGGVARPSMIHVGDRLIATEVRVRHAAHRGRRLAVVIIEDITEAFWAKAALDADDHAALVVDPRGRIVAFNKAARSMFADAETGIEVSRLLTHSGFGERWWETGLTGRRRLHLQVLQHIYQVTLSSVALPGEEERMTVIAFLPIARASAANEATSIESTVVQRR